MVNLNQRDTEYAGSAFPPPLPRYRRSLPPLASAPAVNGRRMHDRDPFGSEGHLDHVWDPLVFLSILKGKLIRGGKAFISIPAYILNHVSHAHDGEQVPDTHVESVNTY